MFKVHNKTPYDMKSVESMFNKFFPYAQKRLGFDKPVSVNLVSDDQNAADPLGKTGFYEPQSMSITIFVDGRHPKDMLRSLSHELVHHKQNCDGRFNDVGEVGEDYAQTNQEMRNMEAEAYLMGNGFLVRDYTDGLKTNTQRESIKMNEQAIRKMTRIILEKLDEGDQWPHQGPGAVTRSRPAGPPEDYELGFSPADLPSAEEEEAERLRDQDPTGALTVAQAAWPTLTDNPGAYTDPLASTGPEGPTAPSPMPPEDYELGFSPADLPYKRDDEETVVMKEEDETPCGCAEGEHPGQTHEAYIEEQSTGLREVDWDEDVSRLEETDLISRDKALREHVSGRKEKVLFDELMKRWCK